MANWIANTKIMSLVTKKMNYLSAKSELLARNISNVDTPGYRRKDVKDFREVLKSNKDGPGLTVKSQDIVQTNEEVNREWESMRMTELESEYRLLVTLYGKYANFIKAVTGQKG